MKLLRKSFKSWKNDYNSDFYLTIGIQGLVVHCDASRVGLECVLMKNEIDTAYAFKKLKFNEKSYKKHDLELADVVIAL